MNLWRAAWGRSLLCAIAVLVIVGVPTEYSRAATPTATVVVSNSSFSTLAVDGSDVAWGRQRGVNNQLWKSTDKGQTWTQVTGWNTLGRRIWYITPLASGALLVAYDTGLNIAIARSADGGATWSTVLNLLCLTQNCSERDTTLTSESIVEGNGFVFLGTYNTATPSVNPSRVYRSANDGQTWTLVNTLTDVRHIHGLAWDSFKNRLYVLTGDSDGDGIRYSSDNGTTLQPLCTGFTCNSIQGFVDPVGGQHFIFGTDNEHTTNRIQKLDTTTGAVTQLKTMPYVSFSSSHANGVWLVAESHEPGPIGDPDIHLYGSSDGGATWATLYSFTLPDGNGSYEMYVDSIYSNGDVAVHVNGQGTVVLRFGTAPVVPPVNTALPTITGTAQQGQTLTSSTGTWTNSPTGFAYQWRRCDAAGNNCQNIASATGSSYLLVAGDVGSRIRVQVTASNGAGSNAATSAATATVTAATSAPVNTALPTITGTAQQAQTLSASTGTWTNSPTGFAYQWRRCDAAGNNCQNIASATSSSYLLVAGDVGSTIRIQVTASNGAGSNAATSAATGVVQVQGPLTNVVLNPGFETNPSEWTAFGNGTSSWATDSVHSGSRSAKIVTTNDSLSRWTQSVNVSPGQRYDASTWIRTTSGRGSLAATFWNGGTYTGLTLETASVTGDWQRVTLSLTVPSGANRIRLELRNAYTMGTRWFDDVELFNTTGGPPPTNPPVNTALPTITGTAQQGQTLAASTGTWTGSPTSYAYQWLRCNASGASCQNIASATSSSYLVASGDVGSTIRVQVTASNAAGPGSAQSAATAVVTATPTQPTNTALPTITGTAQQGQTLAASTGTWTGSPTSYAYQWLRCNASGASCQNIASATSSSYLVASGDVGSTIRVQVTASNAAGPGSAQSAATAVVTATPTQPTNTALPTITGTAQQGQTLAASTGTWTGSPTSYAYQWLRCNASGASCQNIASATSSSYLVASGDVGSTIRVQVTATNAAGPGSAQSAATAVVTATPTQPTNTALPTITGTAQQGQTLAASTGTWTGSPTSYAYQWLRCNASGASCQNIASATSSSYLVASGDVGSTIRVQVTASNAAGPGSAQSAATAVVTATPTQPTNTALPTITGTAQQGQTLAASTGTWTGSPTSYAYQWLRCNASGASCQNIASATSSSYLVASGDVGSTIRVQVTASNAAGPGSAQSAATAVVTSQPPPNPANLCLNPSFETNPTEYTFYGSGTASWASDAAHTGSRSVKIVTSTEALSRWTQNFNVSAGQQYQVSTWIKTSSGSGSLAVNFWNGSTYSGVTIETAAVSGDWQKVTLNVTIPAGMNRMRLELRNGFTVGTRWFDDVEVLQV